MIRIIATFSALGMLLAAPLAMAGESPQEARHELMEQVGDAAKPIGKMLKEEMDFDPDIVMQSFNTWAEAAGTFGDLFPEGSETGYDTEARETIWTDREGFEASLAEFDRAVSAAIEAKPQDLESLNAAAGPVFKSCKACHEDYRIEDD